MSVTHYKWTLERYHTAIDAGLFDDQPVELLQGDLVVMTPEREPHACYSSVGAEYLRQLLREQGSKQGGEPASVRETKPVTLPNDSEPVPDIAIVRSPLRRYLDHHPYPEDIFWLIEYSNTTLAKDMGRKQQAYAAAGILECWVVDLKNDQLKVFCDREQGNYQTEWTVTEGTLSPLAFPSIAIEVQRLFS